MLDLAASCWLDAHSQEVVMPLLGLTIAFALTLPASPCPLHQLGELEEAVVRGHPSQKLLGSCLEAAAATDPSTRPATAAGTLCFQPQTLQRNRVDEKGQHHTHDHSHPLLLFDPHQKLGFLRNTRAQEQGLVLPQAL